jgi:Ca2+-binding RTX toxin-like protein
MSVGRIGRLAFAVSLLVGFGMRAPLGQASSHTPTCDGVKATIVGTAHADHIHGTSHRDVIVALGGNDVVSGGGGNDLICGGSGADTLNGGPGNDGIFGQAGNDELNGDNGNDTLNGGDGSDAENGGPGDDVDQTDGDDDVTNDDGDTVECDDGGDGSDCADQTAADSLDQAKDAADEYSDSNNSFTGFNAAAASGIDSSLTWQDGGTSSVGVIAIKDVAADRVLLTTQSSTGTFFCVADYLNGDETTGQGSTDFTTAASCTGGDEGDS